VATWHYVLGVKEDACLRILKGDGFELCEFEILT
jgi:hypothetical protein